MGMESRAHSPDSQMPSASTFFGVDRPGTFSSSCEGRKLHCHRVWLSSGCRLVARSRPTFASVGFWLAVVLCALGCDGGALVLGVNRWVRAGDEHKNTAFLRLPGLWCVGGPLVTCALLCTVVVLASRSQFEKQRKNDGFVASPHGCGSGHCADLPDGHHLLDGWLHWNHASSRGDARWLHGWERDLHWLRLHTVRCVDRHSDLPIAAC
jgi:hypothetical protein